MPAPERESRRVRLLRDDVAKKIAAGEVIDRPFSVVRELIDNAVDAGASSVKVDLSEGGIGRIRVVDDGVGMSREDLELCYRPHATSKIESVEDLYRTTSLGFRGEALGSIGACARLSIVSSDGNGTFRLEVADGNQRSLEPFRGGRGTAVEVDDLFYNLPGRRRFLKSARAEGNLCRTTFLEKAAAFPDISFQLLSDGEPKLTLPAGSLLERAVAAYPAVFPAGTTDTIGDAAEGFSFTLVHASPAVYRRDRRYIHVYLNRRRIQEYALLQAVEYGFSMVLPGGSFPVGLLFVEADPELVDFNIHPAKREARIRNLKEIHHAVTGAIQAEFSVPAPEPESSPHGAARFFSGFDPPQVAAEEQRSLRPAAPHPHAGATSARLAAPPRRAPAPIDAWKRVSPPPRPGHEGSDIRYLGQAFDLFLICQVDDQLYLVDQHAAHERILYDRLSRPGQESQGLMVPLEIPVDDEGEARFYRELLTKLEPSGFRGELIDGVLRIHAIPASCRGVEKELARFLNEPRGSVENFLRELWADIACKAAVKDGEALERVSAEELLKQTFALTEHRCPHGRPLWFSLSRRELFTFVGRT